MNWYFYTCTGKSKWEPHLASDKDEIIKTLNPELVTILEVNYAIRAGDDRPKDLAFRGPLYFDWDGKDEIEDVLDSVKRFMGRLGEMAFPLEQARWFLTGGKGVHCEIPEACFMDTEALKGYLKTGNKSLPAIYRMLAHSERLVSNHMDLSIYSAGRGRMWRVPNRPREREDGTVTYKVPITAKALKSLDEDSYWEWCSEPRPIITPEPPTRCTQLAVEFSMALGKVVKASKEAQATAKKKIVFEGWTTTPPTIAAAFRGEGIMKNLDLNDIKMQLCIAATAVGFNKLSDEDRFIEAVQGFINSRAGLPGTSHRSASSIEEALRNCFRSVSETPYYHYTAGGLASILEPELRQNPDLSGRHTEETDRDAAINLRASELAGGYHSDSEGTIKVTGKGDSVTVSTYSWEPGSVLKILDPANGTILAYSVVPLVHGKPAQRVVIPLTTLLDSRKLSTHVMQYGGNLELTGPGAVNRVRTSWETFAGGVKALKDAGLAEAVPLEGMYIQSRIPKDSSGAEEFSEASINGRDYDSELNIYWIEAGKVTPSIKNHGSTSQGKNLPVPQYFDPANPGGRYGVDLSSTATTLANPLVPGKDVVQSLLELNGNFFSMAILLGWFTACSLKHPLYMLDRIKNFPILQVYGEAGCGKTTTMNLLLKLFTWREPFRVTAAGSGLTAAAHRMLATGTTSIPMVVDEVKAQNLGKGDWLHWFRQVAQNQYTIGGIVRKAGGRGEGSHHNEMVDDPMYAPLAFMGETLETSQVSLMERIAPAGFHKADKNGREKYALHLLHNSRVVSVLGWTLVQEVMEGSMNSLVKLYDDSLREATDALYLTGNHRIVENGAIILTGFKFFAQTIEKYYPKVFTEKLEAMEHALMDSSRWMRDTPSEVVRLLNFISGASHDPEFSRTRAIKDVHYWFELGESPHGTVNFLLMSCDTVYVLYRERMRSIGENPVFSSGQEMFVAMKNSPLVVDSFDHPDRGNHCVKIDPHKLVEAGVRAFRPT